ncbi:LysR family transcriptional regulator [Vibrio paucivorans]
MSKDLYNTLDLNLLRTFVVLYQEKNMRRAAERLCISQPAISKAVQRLRDHFNDEMFVRTQYGIDPTPFADQLADTVSPILDTLSLALNNSHEFDPAQLSSTIKVALSPFILSSISAELYNAILAEAPNVDVHLLSWSKSTIDELVNDEINLAVNYDIPHAPKKLACRKVTQDSLKMYLRKDHPHQEDTINIKPGFGYSIASIIVADWNSHQTIADKLMKQRGIEVKIGFRSELPSAIADVVSKTDLLFPASRFFSLDNYPQLRRVDVLIDDYSIEPDVFAYFQSKYRNEATIQWLIRLIKSIVDKR